MVETLLIACEQWAGCVSAFALTRFRASGFGARDAYARASRHDRENLSVLACHGGAGAWSGRAVIVSCCAPNGLGPSFHSSNWRAREEEGSCVLSSQPTLCVRTAQCSAGGGSGESGGTRREAEGRA